MNFRPFWRGHWVMSFSPVSDPEGFVFTFLWRMVKCPEKNSTKEYLHDLIHIFLNTYVTMYIQLYIYIHVYTYIQIYPIIHIWKYIIILSYTIFLSGTWLKPSVASGLVCFTILQPLSIPLFTTGFIAEVPCFVLYCTFLQNPAPTPFQLARNSST